ncbi:hypothetical protein VPH35_117830 [Triticum aestivum]
MEASASLCTPSGVRSKLTFKISGYSFQRGFGVGKYFSSAAFNVGVYFWRIKYYPNEDYVSLSVELATRRGHPSRSGPLTRPTNVDSVLLSFANLCGYFLQPSAYLQDDNLAIECDITVLAAITVPPFDIQVPPSNLSDNLRELLKAGEGTDVTFKVRRESFPAHKIVLAMRSPIFKADLFGSMGGGTRRTITIEDMQPAIFSALLHFIYTDSLPSMGTSDGDDGEDMVKYLVVATNRYAMKRMKVIHIDSFICKFSLSLQNLAYQKIYMHNIMEWSTTLALSDHCHCNHLKNACLEFLTSPDRIADVVASEGYAHIKRSFPAIIADIFEGN